MKPPRILVAPLNWGLGHATRCVPLIRALEAMCAVVYLASDGVAADLLAKEFPHLPLLRLPSYRIRYRSANMVANIAPQLPRIAWAIIAENIATRRLVRQYRIDGIIADHRYGVRVTGVPSVFITHQINLLTPHSWLTWSVRAMNYALIRRFGVCWIPDTPREPSLSGLLSHPVHLPRVRYIGIQSRMQPLQCSQQYDVIAVLSGPEPQRTLLEEKITAQLLALPHKALIVKGLPHQSPELHALSPTLHTCAYLTSQALNQVMAASGVVVARSGYSTVMDLVKLQRRAILIPTPGQTEQEYLAAQLGAGGFCVVQQQSSLSLADALAQVGNCRSWDAWATDDLLTPLLREWVNGL